MELEGRRIVITGATGGMGSCLARALSEKGARLALTGRDEEKLRALSSACAGSYAMALDMADEARVSAFFEGAGEALGGADALVCFTGMSVSAKIEEMALEDFSRVMDANVRCAFLACKHFLPIARENAQIVNVSSMAGKRANPNSPVYCAAKAAADMLMCGLQAQAAPRGVRVTTVSPGGTDTPFWGARKVAREKLLLPDDVAGAILYALCVPARVTIREIQLESIEMLKPAK